MARPFWVGGAGSGSTVNSARSDIIFIFPDEALDVALKVSNMISVSFFNASALTKKREIKQRFVGRTRRRRAGRLYLKSTPSISSFDFGHLESHERLRDLLGGKGFSLWLMRRELGLPVPPGFTIATSECQPYLQEGLRASLKQDVRQAVVSTIEREIGRRFADASDPLLLSVRSGAAVSMPGMMDTVLNVGMTPDNADALAEATGNPVFALQSYLRFLVAFAETVHGLDLGRSAGLSEDVGALRAEIATRRNAILRAPQGASLDDPAAQLFDAIGAVFRSWNSPRAIAFRERAHVEDANGTAVTIQAMVFGNLDERSGTGVAFTRNPSTGEPAPCGDFLFRAQAIYHFP